MIKGIIRVIISYGLMIFSLLLAISLASFSPNDLSFYTASPNTPPLNVLGFFGLKIAIPFVFFYGYASWLWVLFALSTGIRLLTGITPKDLFLRFVSVHYLSFILSIIMALSYGFNNFAQSGVFGILVATPMLNLLPEFFWVPILAMVFLAGVYTSYRFPKKLMQKFLDAKNTANQENIVIENAPSLEGMGEIEEMNEWAENNEIESVYITRERLDSSPYPDVLEDEIPRASQVPYFLEDREEDREEMDEDFPLYLNKKRLFDTKPIMFQDVEVDLLSPYLRSKSPFYKNLEEKEQKSQEQDYKIKSALEKAQNDTEALDELEQSSSIMLPTSEWARETGLRATDMIKHTRLSFDHGFVEEDIADPKTAEDRIFNEKEEGEVLKTEGSVKKEGTAPALEEELTVPIEQHISNFPPIDEDSLKVELLKDIEEDNVPMSEDDYVSSILNENASSNIDGMENLSESEKLLIQGLSRTNVKNESQKMALREKLQKKQQELAKAYYSNNPSEAIEHGVKTDAKVKAETHEHSYKIQGIGLEILELQKNYGPTATVSQPLDVPHANLGENFRSSFLEDFNNLYGTKDSSPLDEDTTQSPIIEGETQTVVEEITEDDVPSKDELLKELMLPEIDEKEEESTLFTSEHDVVSREEIALNTESFGIEKFTFSAIDTPIDTSVEEIVMDAPQKNDIGAEELILDPISEETVTNIPKRSSVLAEEELILEPIVEDSEMLEESIVLVLGDEPEPSFSVEEQPFRSQKSEILDDGLVVIENNTDLLEDDRVTSVENLAFRDGHFVNSRDLPTSRETTLQRNKLGYLVLDRDTTHPTEIVDVPKRTSVLIKDKEGNVLFGNTPPVLVEEKISEDIIFEEPQNRVSDFEAQEKVLEAPAVLEESKNIRARDGLEGYLDLSKIVVNDFAISNPSLDNKVAEEVNLDEMLHSVNYDDNFDEEIPVVVSSMVDSTREDLVVAEEEVDLNEMLHSVNYDDNFDEEIPVVVSSMVDSAREDLVAEEVDLDEMLHSVNYDDNFDEEIPVVVSSMVDSTREDLVVAEEVDLDEMLHSVNYDDKDEEDSVSAITEITMEDRVEEDYKPLELAGEDPKNLWEDDLEEKSYSDSLEDESEEHDITDLSSSELALMPKIATDSHLVKPIPYPLDSSQGTKNSVTTKSQKSQKTLIFPNIEDLEPNTEQISKEEEEAEIETTMKMIEDTYESFNINMQVVDYNRGPTITRFELDPPSGLKLRTILNLQDDLALQAGTSNLRIISPVEGRSLIGIEVPNKVRKNFLLREQIESTLFQNTEATLPLILGIDVGGKEVVGDLATTPHLLIAGTTGSGKSVYVNALIMGLLFKLSAEDLRFIMIDPKMVELELYRGIPHLLAPIITKPEEAMAALEWAVQEMDRRYKILSGLSVRNIKEYQELGKNSPTGDQGYEKLPYIVVIVDEFANLMLRAPKDTEKHISRLASMSRAVGIHLVLATQRPSVDVVTGVIKANFPSRIAFRVSSKIDSRTILDKNGAESLLGRGDMLYMSPEHIELMRIQSPYASGEDIARAVNTVKKNGPPDYAIDFSEVLAKQEEDSSNDNSRTDAIGDPFFEEVLNYAVDNGEISASGIQRRFRVGYNRASRLIESMKDMKIITPPASAGKGWVVNITRDEISSYLD